MAKVLIELASGADGEVQLADNQFVEFWKMVFLRHKNKFPIRRRQNHEHQFYGDAVYYFRNDTPNYFKKESTLELKQHHVDRVNRSIEKLLEYNVPWTRGKAALYSSFEDCDQIHRGFTTLVFTKGMTDHVAIKHDDLIALKRSYSNMNYSRAWPTVFYNIIDIEPYMKERYAGNDKPEILEYLHEINAAIHNIEDNCLYNPRKLVKNDCYIKYCDAQIQLQPKLDWQAKAADGVTDAVKLDWNFECSLLEAFHSIQGLYQKGYNVFDLKNILGKDYETCWTDYDNPYNFDITNTVGTTKGGFEIKPNFRLFYDEILKTWLKDDWNWDQHISITYPIPIGKIDDKFLQEHLTIKGGIDQGQRVNKKIIDKEGVKEIMQGKHITKVDLIE